MKTMLFLVMKHCLLPSVHLTDSCSKKKKINKIIIIVIIIIVTKICYLYFYQNMIVEKGVKG